MYSENEEKRDVSIHNWIGTLLLAMVPVVNVIMAIVWICAGRSASKRNFGIASLILFFLMLAAAFVALVPFGHQTLDWMESVNTWLHKALAA
jgi:ABC-type transport system involved in cytochrome bd biosynthesis fused ATPase/permease subunit